MLCRDENLTDKEFDSLSNPWPVNYSPNSYKYIIYLVTKYVNTQDWTKEDPDSSHRKGHKYNSIMECQLPMQCPLLYPCNLCKGENVSRDIPETCYPMPEIPASQSNRV